MTEKIYHERQTLYRCGLHALNNVLQDLQLHLFNRLRYVGPVFTKASLDAACDELTQVNLDAGNGLMSWVWNPHKAPLGLGNYDVNALTLTLQQKGYVMQWVDKRQPVNDKLIKLDKIKGILCNVVITTILSNLWMQRHWFAIRKLHGVCYNLDSKLSAPRPFENDAKCYQFLQELVATGECELFVITKQVEETTSIDTH
ncbi:hypothetical protein PsorP6_011841 [Peronosclerospora sorghi]|uniref:Uncharacterized protein n=1 Tax=Peronosclerospora sorghi TaxID=230839 RepID=A0ACC0WHK3_9STRA|nr:hypothetical protein PsorP6_011841 [Peronosclerospora sorghi]